MQNFKNILFTAILGIFLMWMANCQGFGLYDIGNTTTDPDSNTDTTATSYRVFVTTTATTGDMAFNGAPASCLTYLGVERANCFCEEFAITAGIDDPNTTFRAWLSQSYTAPNIAAICNIQGMFDTNSCSNIVPDYNYVNMNGEIVFNSLDDIFNGGTPVNPVTYNEDGIMASSTDVWTGTDSYGMPTTLDCSGWTIGSGGGYNLPTGTYGNSSVNDSGWTFWGSYNSNSALPIYCFEGPN
jgi:hypothetical protein